MTTATDATTRPGDATTDPGDAAPGTLRRLLGLLHPYRRRLVVMVALGVVGSGLQAVVPLVLGRATDLVVAGVVSGDVPPGSPVPQVAADLRASGNEAAARLLEAGGVAAGGLDLLAVGRVVAAAMVLAAGASALLALQARLAADVTAAAAYDLRERVSAKIATIPVSAFDSDEHGDLLSRATNDVDNVGQALQQSVGRLIPGVLSVLAMAVLMVLVSPLLALLVLGCVVVSVLVSGRIATRAQPAFVAAWDATGALAAHTEETYDGHAAVRTLDRVEAMQATFDEHNAELRRAGCRARAAAGSIEPTMTFFADLGYVLVVAFGVLRVAVGALSVGDVQAFLQYTTTLTGPVAELAGMVGELQSGTASAARVFALLDEPDTAPEPAAAGSATPGATRGRVEFRDVDFGYRPGVPVLHGLSFVVEPGTTTAVVGTSGAGKTTVANLLLRFYDPDRGHILLDDVDIAALPRVALQERVGIVPQDAWLFVGTVAENVAYGRPDASRAEVERAGRATGVSEIVAALPEGWDTVLDAGSGMLSSGERQLVVLARALLADRPVVVLDEATSAVDPTTDRLVRDAMGAMGAGRTTIVIAHRLATAHEADRVVVLDAGRVVEQGAPEALLARGGAYARLHAAVS